MQALNDFNLNEQYLLSNSLSSATSNLIMKNNFFTSKLKKTTKIS